MKRLQGSDITVTKEDQANINTFSKLYSKNQDNQGLLAAINEKIQQHKDTLDELQLNDDEDLVRYRFGMCFFTLPSNYGFIQLRKQEHLLRKISQDLRLRKQTWINKWMQMLKRLKNLSLLSMENLEIQSIWINDHYDIYRFSNIIKII